MRKQVAYLGPEGTYAEKAAHILSKLSNYDSPIFVPCKGLHSVIKSIAYKNCDAAVVPIENSVEGGVTSTLDALWKFPNININKAIVLPIKHALLSSGELKDISEVLSHPQALAQCSEWLLENLPEAILLPTNSTSEAVNMVKGSSFRAAIGSKSLVEIADLKELAFPINDVPGNCTRFVLLTEEKELNEANDANIASFAFSLLSNRPGALLKALSYIGELGFNMSKIESRPSKRELGEYVIYIDVDINEQTDIANFRILKEKIKPLCEHLIDFGCYLSKNIKLS
ncbi:MAG: prephenate dehydratase [Prochlorococcus sp. SP3034]|nr:prephenate dehydratase [Prochlorococcus sp. SP3034]|tara:strand:- start:2325 stop:3179 length:855 start_codon:yes stop_codon:yes gene_type:complete